MDKLFKKLNITPKNLDLYKQAFTHSSYAYEHQNETSYETLEFLGDTIVDLVVSDYLYRSNKYQEGEMTKIRAAYVCENALYEYANDLEFSKYIRVGVGEYHSGGKYKKAIVADTFESLIGAIYIDLGFEKAKEVALNIIVPYIEDENIRIFKDNKSALQEAVQTDQRPVEYEVLETTGPSHDRRFKVVVKIEGISYGIGTGKSKKQAEQEAAKQTMNMLAKE